VGKQKRTTFDFGGHVTRHVFTQRIYRPPPTSLCVCVCCVYYLLSIVWIKTLTGGGVVQCVYHVTKGRGTGFK
jgi:hypothetical protein